MLVYAYKSWHPTPDSAQLWPLLPTYNTQEIETV